jgi:hypothetical protein
VLNEAKPTAFGLALGPKFTQDWRLRIDQGIGGERDDFGYA